MPGQAWISGSCCLHSSDRLWSRRAEDTALQQVEWQRFPLRHTAAPPAPCLLCCSCLGTGMGCTHPGSVSFSIIPAAEGTCLKVDPEIARLCAAAGLAGLQGLAGGQPPTAAVGTFQAAPAGVARAGMEPLWGRPRPGNAAQPLTIEVHGEQSPMEIPVLTHGTSKGQEGTGTTGISWGRAIGITSHLKCMSQDIGFGSAIDLG